MGQSNHPASMAQRESYLCPVCLKKTAKRHCEDESANCDLVVCMICGGYGKPDGTRWRDVLRREPD